MKPDITKLLDEIEKDFEHGHWRSEVDLSRSDFLKLKAAILELVAENEKLDKENSDLRHGAGFDEARNLIANKHIDELTLENAKYRAALESISSWCDNDMLQCNDGDLGCTCHEHRIAKEALAGGDGE